MTAGIDYLINRRLARLAVRATLSSNDVYIERSSPLQRRLSSTMDWSKLSRGLIQ
jgi:hypothetical protein